MPLTSVMLQLLIIASFVPIDILVQKEDLEVYIQSALEAARNKDDLAKLAVAVVRCS